jgi:hypothetical protein
MDPDSPSATPGPLDDAPYFDQSAGAAAYESLRNKPCRVGRLVVRGLQRTKIGVVRQELERVRHAGTLEEIRDALLTAHADLLGLGIFNAVEIVIDQSAEVRKHLALRCRDGRRESVSPAAVRCSGFALTLLHSCQGGDRCDVIASFEESRMLHLHSGTYVQGTDGACSPVHSCAPGRPTLQGAAPPCKSRLPQPAI